MKKTSKFLVAVMLILAMSLALVACVDKDADGLIKLDAPTGITSDGGDTISWDAVDNAEKYYISIDGIEEEFETTQTTFIVPVTSNGKYNIKIRAYGDGKEYGTSDYSEVFEYIKVKALAKPQVVIDQTLAKATWSAVEYADRYFVYVEKVGAGVVEQLETKDLFYNFTDAEGAETKKYDKPGEYSINVMAIPADDSVLYKKSSSSTTVSYYKTGVLAVPTFKELTAQTLYWNKVTAEGLKENQLKYQIKVTHNGESWELTPSTNDNIGLVGIKTKEGKAITEAGEYALQIRAIGDGKIYQTTEYSKIDAKFTLFKLPQVKDVTFDVATNTVKWKVDSMDNIKGFEVRLESNKADGTKGVTKQIEVERKNAEGGGEVLLEYTLKIDDKFFSVGEDKVITELVNDSEYYGRNYDIYIIAQKTIGDNKIIDSEQVKVDGIYSNYSTPKLFTESEGLGESYYLIKQASELPFIQTKLDANYRITHDIDYKGYAFTPIKDFAGKIYGLDHVIKNVVIKAEDGATNVGFIANTTSENAIVQDLFFNNIKVDYNTEAENIGIVVGSNMGRVEDVYVKGEIVPHAFKSNVEDKDKVVGKHVGGVVGSNLAGSSIINVTSDVKVRGQIVGGLAGYNAGGIHNSYAIGDVYGDICVKNAAAQNIYVGGLVGQSAGENSAIVGSFAINNVLAEISRNTQDNIYVGGLIGLNESVVMNSYAGDMYSRNITQLGKISAKGYLTKVGGFVGVNKGTITNSYATLQAKGSIVASFVAVNEGTIENTYATGGVVNEGMVGGFVKDNTGTIKNSFFKKPFSGYVDNKVAGTTMMSDTEVDDTKFNLVGKLGKAFGKFDEKPAPVLKHMIYAPELKLTTKLGANDPQIVKYITTEMKEGKEVQKVVEINSSPVDINSGKDYDTYFVYKCPEANMKKGASVRAVYGSKKDGVELQILVTLK